MKTALICNIIHLLHLLLITGVWGAFTKRRFLFHGRKVLWVGKALSGFAWVRKISNDCRIFHVLLRYIRYPSMRFLYVIVCFDRMKWNVMGNQPIPFQISTSKRPPRRLFINHPFPHQHPHSPQQAFPSSPTSPPYHPTLIPHHEPANTPQLLVCMSHTAGCFRPIRSLRFVDSLRSTGLVRRGIEVL